MLGCKLNLLTCELLNYKLNARGKAGVLQKYNVFCIQSTHRKMKRWIHLTNQTFVLKSFAAPVEKSEMQK